MRSDMFEVIIERPRHRRGRWEKRLRAGRERERIRRDPDEARACESMRFRSGPPHLNENLAPLRRFLASRVGRPWNAVHAEICAHIAPASAVQKHVLDHLAEFVATRTYVVDGVVYGTGRRWSGSPTPVEPGWGARFYVCPETGVLRAAARIKRTPRRYWMGPDACWLDGQRELRLERGVWHVVRFVEVRAPRGRGPDPALRETLGASLFAQLEAHHAARRERTRRLVSRTELSPAEFEAIARECPPRPAPTTAPRR